MTTATREKPKWWNWIGPKKIPYESFCKYHEDIRHDLMYGLDTLDHTQPFTWQGWRYFFTVWIPKWANRKYKLWCWIFWYDHSPLFVVIRSYVYRFVNNLFAVLLMLIPIVATIGLSLLFAIAWWQVIIIALVMAVSVLAVKFGMYQWS